MADEIRHSGHPIEHAGVRCESSDASFGWIVAVMVGAVVILLVLHLGVLLFFERYRDHLAAINRSPYPLAPGPSTAVPSEPRLEQIDRLSGAAAAKAHDDAEKLRRLNSYGPAETEGFVHIPIERAMQWVVEKNLLPARPEPPADARRRSSGLVDAGESNSGRLFKGGPK